LNDKSLKDILTFAILNYLFIVFLFVFLLRVCDTNLPGITSEIEMLYEKNSRNSMYE